MRARKCRSGSIFFRRQSRRLTYCLEGAVLGVGWLEIKGRNLQLGQASDSGIERPADITSVVSEF